MKQEIVNKILSETETGYDSMAEKFSQTRKFFWRGMEFIQGYAKAGDRVLDFGCGNGRLLELFPDRKIDYTGVDISQKLIDLAKNKYAGEGRSFQKILASQDSLAFPDNNFNAIYSIAVFHHFPNEHAAKMARELYRVARPGGYVVVTAWNLWQKNYLKNILKNWWGKLRGESGMDWNDCHISFMDNQGKIFQRYHHAFTRNELEKIFSKAGFLTEKITIINRRNIVLVAKKA